LQIWKAAMELRHLRYFVAVAEEGSLTVAAGKRLHTAQPSLSRQIRDLEDQVGVPLLSRSVHGVELTAAGRAFLDHARLALTQAEAAVEAARRAADLMGDGVNIASRLEGICEPGGVCLSEDAYRQVKSRLELQVADLGRQNLKNIAEPVRAYLLRQGAPATQKPPPAATKTRGVWARWPALAAGLALVLLAAGPSPGAHAGARVVPLQG
jgi:molybdenum-dependent DNA-binding transcriptional regulator ModE